MMQSRLSDSTTDETPDSPLAVESFTKQVSFHEWRFELTRDVYMKLRQEKTLFELGYPLSDDLTPEKLDEQYIKAQKAFNEQIKLKVKFEEEQKEIQDYSNYTVDQYNGLQELDDKLNCFKQMFHDVHKQIFNKFGHDKTVYDQSSDEESIEEVEEIKPVEQPISLKQIIKCTDPNCAQLMVNKEKYAVILGPNIHIDGEEFQKMADAIKKYLPSFNQKQKTTATPKTPKRIQAPKTTKQWAQEFEAIGQLSHRKMNLRRSSNCVLGTSLIRFADFCFQFGKQCLIACSTEEQLKALEAIRSKISLESTNTCYRIQFNLMQGESDRFQQKLEQTDCALKIGDIYTNKGFKDLVNKLLNKHNCPVIDLRALNSDLFDNEQGVVLKNAFDDTVGEVQDCLTQFLRSFMDHVNKKALKRQIWCL